MTQSANIKAGFEAVAKRINELASASGGGGSSLVFGQVMTSPFTITDAGLLPLDGSVIREDGIYKKAVLKIIALKDTDSSAFVTETDWQARATKFGECERFVIGADGDVNTLRVPKLIDSWKKLKYYIVLATVDADTTGLDTDTILPTLTRLESAINDCKDMVANVTVDVMTGATAETDGQAGTVPAPSAGDQDKVLKGDGTWGSLATRNIGEYVFSALPQTDAGLHLMDGSLIASNGMYSDFVTYVKDLQAKYPSVFCTQEEFGASLSAYGSCGKFVVSDDGVRLPKISDIMQGTTDVTALGELVEAGLPNIEGEVRGGANSVAGFIYQTGVFQKGESTSFSVASGSAQSNYLRLDASAYNPIYGNSSTVQPQTVKYLVYIVVATSTKTSIEVDIDKIATDLNGKADTTLVSSLVSQVNALQSQLTTLNSATRIISTWVDGTSGYRIWSDGYCEQWGSVTISSAGQTVTLPKAFKDTNYVITASGGTNKFGNTACYSKTSSTFLAWTSDDDSFNAGVLDWVARGYVSV